MNNIFSFNNSEENEIEYSDMGKTFHQYYLALCLFAQKLLNERVAAEDIVVDVFIRLWNKEKNFAKYTNIKGLLYVSVKNACHDLIKARKRRDAKISELSYLSKKESEEFVLNEIVRSEVLRDLYAELQKLPPECRKVMQLLFVEGWDYKKISAGLGVSVSTVKNQKARGIQLLKKKLGVSVLLFLTLFNHQL